MPVSSLDHINIRTENLKKMTEFYAKVLGMKKEGALPSNSAARGSIAAIALLFISSR